MNVLMATTFFPPHVGGVEYHALNLSKHLAIRGHRITVLTSALKEVLSDSQNELSKNIEVVELKTCFLPARPYPSMSSVGIAIGTQERIKELIREKDITVVHAHGHHYPLSWASIKAAETMHIPSVLTLHGLYALDPTKRFGRSLEEIFNMVFFSRMLEKSTSVIGLTRTITEYAKKYAKHAQKTDNKFYTIPNGVDVENFLKAKPLKRVYRKKYGIPENAIVFLFCGRFTEAKGVLENKY
jgi:glycosyltransferase involved in cell wall biosynthesis